MKKTLITTIALLAAAASSFAQGAIEFGNNFSGVFRAPIYNVGSGATSGQSALGLPVGTAVYGGPLLSGAGYTMGLFVGAVGASSDALQLVATAALRSSATPTALPNGLISTVTVALDGTQGKPTFAAGSQIAFQIRAWDNRGGTLNTWAAALAAGAASGQSEVVTSGPLGGTGPSGPILNPSTVGWSSFALVPEPSTIALSVLGLGSLLLFRRRK